MNIETPQAYEQLVLFASKINCEAIISDLDWVIDKGVGLDDLVTVISGPAGHTTEYECCLFPPLSFGSWQSLRNKLVEHRLKLTKKKVFNGCRNT